MKVIFVYIIGKCGLMGRKERDAEEIAILIHRAEQMGFKIVDLYVVDDELIAFTCSKSKEYIDAISNIEV